MNRQCFEIIIAPLAERLRAAGFEMREPHERFYPDGSVLADHFEAGEWLRDKMSEERGGYGSFHFRPLAPFGDRNYLLIYPGWYALLLKRHDEMGVTVMPNFNDPTDDERDLSRVRVRIQLYCKLDEMIAGDLAAAVRRWFANIGSKGVFDEAGVSLLSPVMQYGGTDAGFEMDASRSGQDTLNTLVIAILSWAMSSRRPLCLIDLASEPCESVFKSPLTVMLGNLK